MIISGFFCLHSQTGKITKDKYDYERKVCNWN